MADSQLALVSVKLDADVSGFKQVMDDLPKSVDTAAKEIAKSADEMGASSGESFLNMSHIFETAMGVFTGEVLFEALKEAGALLKELFIDHFTEGVTSAGNAQSAIQRLNQSLASNGIYSHSASEEMINFSEELEKNTGVHHSNTLASMATLEMLGHFTTDGLKVAESAALDLSQAMNIDLERATMMIGKAAEGNVTGFQRLGMHIEKGSTDAETYANALARLATMQGASEAALNTYAGANRSFNSTMESTNEELGNVLVENVAWNEITKASAAILGELKKYISDNGQALREDFSMAIMFAVASMQALVSIIDVFERMAVIAFQAVMTTVDGLATALYALAAGPFMLVEKGLIAIGNATKLFDTEGMTKNLQGFTDNLKSMATATAGHAKTMVDAIKGPLDSTKAIESELDKLALAADTGYAKVAEGAKLLVEPHNHATEAVKKLTDAQNALADSGEKLIESQNKKDDPALQYDEDLKAMQSAVSRKSGLSKDYTNARKSYIKEYEDAEDAANQKEVEELIAKNSKLMEIDAKRYKSQIDENKKSIESDMKYMVTSEDEIMLKKEEADQKEMDNLLAKNAAMKGMNDAAYAENIRSNDARIKVLMDGEDKNSMHSLKVQKDLQTAQEALNKKHLAGIDTMLTDIEVSTKTHGEAGFQVAKNLSIAQAVMKTYEGATAAFASLADIPFIGVALGIAAAAAAIVMGFENVSAIEATHLAGGIDSVPGIGNMDSVLAKLTPGERVVSKESNQDLTSFLSGSGPLMNTLNALADRLTGSGGSQQPIVIQIGGKTITEVLNDEIASGRKLVF